METQYKQCAKCKELKSEDNFYKSKRVNGLAYTCKQCHRLAVRGYRHVEDSYAWWYRRLEKIKYSARKRGLEFNLRVEDLKEIKNADTCYYCSCVTDTITLDRKDNARGYVPDNVVPACYACNKLKSNIFNEAEMLIVGKAVKMYNKRMGLDRPQPIKYGEDLDKIREIVNE